ncbi:hypothetical protein COCNU_16G002080 [Cocos nucifera]|uniref:Uncharacterized protein n=1 Tax=Cocos nucifera TaxID=13894 RepID=A0A8K0IYC4_COCNU|nr:hypothetical protein COCNU_16G002080 [Cocos nucifera]
MSRHRRQASQALPVVFDVAQEEPPKGRGEGAAVTAATAGGGATGRADVAAGAAVNAQTKVPLPTGRPAGAKPEKKPSDGGS